MILRDRILGIPSTVNFYARLAPPRSAKILLGALKGLTPYLVDDVIAHAPRRGYIDQLRNRKLAITVPSKCMFLESEFSDSPVERAGILYCTSTMEEAYRDASTCAVTAETLVCGAYELAKTDLTMAAAVERAEAVLAGKEAPPERSELVADPLRYDWTTNLINYMKQAKRDAVDGRMAEMYNAGAVAHHSVYGFGSDLEETRGPISITEWFADAEGRAVGPVDGKIAALMPFLEFSVAFSDCYSRFFYVLEQMSQQQVNIRWASKLEAQRVKSSGHRIVTVKKAAP